MAKDPVCGMMIDPATSESHTDYRGDTYYFCSHSCKKKFESDPSVYVKKKGWLTRFLDWVAQGNKEQFNGKPPSCCDRQLKEVSSINHIELKK